MKLLGALVWIGAAALIGHYFALERERRVLELAAMLHGLHMLETEVVFGRTLLAEALGRIAASNRECRLFFERAAAGVAAGRGVARSWNAALATFGTRAALDADDLRPLRKLGEALGLSDAEDQRRHLRLARSELEARLEAARERLPQASRLRRALGLCMGLMVAILLY